MYTHMHRYYFTLDEKDVIAQKEQEKLLLDKSV